MSSDRNPFSFSVREVTILSRPGLPRVYLVVALFVSKSCYLTSQLSSMLLLRFAFKTVDVGINVIDAVLAML